MPSLIPPMAILPASVAALTVCANSKAQVNVRVLFMVSPGNKRSCSKAARLFSHIALAIPYRGLLPSCTKPVFIPLGGYPRIQCLFRLEARPKKPAAAGFSCLFGELFPEEGVGQRAHVGALFVVCRATVAAFDVFVVEGVFARCLHFRHHFPRVAGVDAVVAG